MSTPQVCSGTCNQKCILKVPPHHRQRVMIPLSYRATSVRVLDLATQTVA